MTCCFLSEDKTRIFRFKPSEGQAFLPCLAETLYFCLFSERIFHRYAVPPCIVIAAPFRLHGP